MSVAQPIPPVATGRWPVRHATDEDWDALTRVIEHAFGANLSPELNALERSLVEPGRTLVVTDDAEVVGTATAFSHLMTVPGGPVPVAGVSNVGVLATHRRQGILRTLMTAQLHELHDTGGEAVAALWASEPAIYGRFGYGPASRTIAVTLPRFPTPIPAAPVDPSLRLRLVRSAASVDVVEPVYDAVRALRPGFHARDARWQARETFDAPGDREGRSELWTVLASDGTGLRGYARYQVQDADGPMNIVHVRELFGADLAAETALLRYVTDIDLSGSARFTRRPVADVLFDLLVDLRGANPMLRDGLYVRVVDVDRALGQRAWAAEVDLVVEIVDDLCPWNAGRWHVRGGPDGAGVPGGATCSRTDNLPDLTLPVRTLGAGYLGSAGVVERLFRAGQAEEHTDGAVRRLSAAMSWHVEPWAPFVW